MSAAVYVAFEHNLRTSLDQNLHERSASYASLIDTSAKPVRLRLAVDTRQERAKGEALVRLYDPNGRLLEDASPAAGTTAAELELAKRAAAGGGDTVGTFSYAGSESFRVLAVPISDSRGVSAVLVTGLEESQVADPLGYLRLILFIAVPCTSLGLAAGSFLIVRRGLRPVVAITSTAERIAAGDLHERIAGVESHDEVGELARTFNHMIERLAETVERERRFTADAAHELRTPLTAMEASVDVTLSKERSVSDYQRALEAVRGQTQRLEQLTRQLLMLSRLDAETFQEKFETLDLGQLLQAVTSSFKERHSKAHIRLHGCDQPTPLLGNSELLARAFSNVLENAVIHCSADVTIDVSIRRVSHESVVQIADDGPGVDEALTQTLFHRFRRGDSARSRGGSGLGLAIVDSIVRVHGGQVAIGPSAGGTTVEFLFRTVE